MPSDPARAASELIDIGFARYHADFLSLTARAAGHFAARDWKGGEQDDRRRLALYEQYVQETLGKLRERLGARMNDRDLWAATRTHYAERRAGRPNVELAETFYNSITRRVFATVGVDPYIEFVADALTVPQTMEAEPCFRTFRGYRATAEIVAEVLRSYDLGVPYLDLERDARRVAARVDERLRTRHDGQPIDRVEVLEPAFYRNKGAYVIGRLWAGKDLVPFILPLLHTPRGGLRVDAVLLTSNDASKVFSFTRSYFHAHCDQPWRLVRFLKTLMPLKRIAELYISLGYTKHGKTELYRDLCVFLDGTHEHFVPARGTRGMVMAVFTLPGYDVVFKVIRDRFVPPKQTTREEVKKRYRFVMLHDRVGRLADVQEFEHLEFALERFSPELLEYLLEAAPSNVHVEGETLVVEHLYTERRVTPLNLYLQEASREEAEEAVLDCGQAIKDLAAANIFPGDMLVKNFGVTRHGRVIFYDYDELDRLDAFTFRDKPKPQSDFEMMSADAWYYVGPNDVFPEEIGTFLGFPAELNKVFLEHHGDLLEPQFWKEMQARQQQEEPVDLFPYPPEKRFPLDEAPEDEPASVDEPAASEQPEPREVPPLL